MGEFTAYTSRWRAAGLVLTCIIFAVLGLWMVGAFGPAPTSSRYPAPLPTVIGWLVLPVCALFGVAWVKRLLAGGIQLEVGPSGVRWHPWSDQLIPWSEVLEVNIWSYQRQTCIVLKLRNPDRFPGRGLAASFASLNRAMTGGDICISLTGTDRSFDDAMSAMVRFRAIDQVA